MLWGEAKKGRYGTVEMLNLDSEWNMICFE